MTTPENPRDRLGLNRHQESMAESVLPHVGSHFRSVLSLDHNRVDVNNVRYVAVHGTSIQTLGEILRTGHIPGMTGTMPGEQYAHGDLSVYPAQFMDIPDELRTDGITAQQQHDGYDGSLQIIAQMVGHRHAFLTELGIPLSDLESNNYAFNAVNRTDLEDLDEADQHFRDMGFTDAQIRRAARHARRFKGIRLGIKQSDEYMLRAGDREYIDLSIAPRDPDGLPYHIINGIEAVGEFDKRYVEAALGIEIPRIEVPEMITNRLNEQGIDPEYIAGVTRLLSTLQDPEAPTERKIEALRMIPSYSDFVQDEFSVPPGTSPDSREEILDLVSAADSAVSLDEMADELNLLGESLDPATATLTEEHIAQVQKEYLKGVQAALGEEEKSPEQYPPKALERMIFHSFRLSQGQVDIQQSLFIWLGATGELGKYQIDFNMPENIAGVRPVGRHSGIDSKQASEVRTSVWDALLEAKASTESASQDEGLKDRVMVSLFRSYIDMDEKYTEWGRPDRNRKDDLNETERKIPDADPATTPTDSLKDPYASWLRRYVLDGQSTGIPGFDALHQEMRPHLLTELRRADSIKDLTTADDDVTELSYAVRGIMDMWEAHHPNETFISPQVREEIERQQEKDARNVSELRLSSSSEVNVSVGQGEDIIVFVGDNNGQDAVVEYVSEGELAEEGSSSDDLRIKHPDPYEER